MRFTKTKHRLFVLCAGCWGFAGIVSASTLPPIWFPAEGTQITSWSDETNGVGLYTLNFPFQFKFLGINYTSATLSSNGSIYFSPSGAPAVNPQPQASSSLFLQGAWPRIAPAWYDIQDIDGSGSVYLNLLPNQVLVTFMNVASCAPPVCAPAPASDLATFQVSLNSDGSIIFGYQALNSIGTANTFVGSSQAIIGVTGGMGATDASVNLSSGALSPTFDYISPGSTVYQAINPSDGSNLAGLDLIFKPQAGLTWQVTSDFPGHPAPEPSTLAEITLSAMTLLIWRGRIRFRGRV
jgi:hypothetical protein